MQTGFYRVTFSLLPEMPSHITELTKIVILECHFNCNKLQQFLLFTDSSYMTITAVKKKINNSIISSFYRQENWGTERRTRKLTVNIFLESKGLSSLFKFCFSLCFLTLSHRLHHTLFVLPPIPLQIWLFCMHSVLLILALKHSALPCVCVVNVIVNCGSHMVALTNFVDTHCLCCVPSSNFVVFSFHMFLKNFFFTLQLCLTGDKCETSLDSHNNLFFSCIAGIL